MADEFPPGSSKIVRQGSLFVGVHNCGGELYAIGNRDPYSGAYVISRGITGSHDGVPTVASPMYKHVFDLRNGACLDDPTVALPTYPVRRYRGLVWVQR